MSAIDVLIAEMCPGGVECRTLGEVGQFTRGNGLQKKDFVEEGIGCIHYGQIYTYYGTSATTTKSFVSAALAARLRTAAPGDLVVTTTSENIEDVGKAVAWLGDSEIAIGGHSCAYSHRLDPMYVAYCFQTGAFHRQKTKLVKGTKVKELSGPDLARITIPVPPIEIQREITSILTKMESLKAELEAELEARRRQYVHYRDYLLGFARGAKVRWVPMGEVGEFIRGRRFTKEDVVPNGLGSIHYGEIYTRYGVYAAEALSHVRPELGPYLRFAVTGDIVIAAVGETVEDVCKAVAWLGEDDVAIHDDCFAYRHSLNPKFVSYFFQTGAFHADKNKYVARAKVKRISGESLAKIKIPVPPPEEQARVVEILDKFDALVNDIVIGLPAEITARRQQYEYYRDRLLTFDLAAG